MKRLAYYAAGIAALGYVASRVPWGKVRRYLAEANIPEALANRLDSWRGTVSGVAKTVLEEPMFGAKAPKNVRQLHS